MLRGARKELGLTTDQTVVIGDTMETDILGGVQLGFKTILVLSGGTRREDLDRYAYQPDLIVDSIAELDHEALVERFGMGRLRPRYRTDDRVLLRVGPARGFVTGPARQAGSAPAGRSRKRRSRRTFLPSRASDPRGDPGSALAGADAAQ